MTIAYYVSAHGFGHFVRSSEVMKSLPPDVPLLIRSAVPEWFRDQQLKERDHAWLQAEFDCGTLGPDSLTVDASATFDRAQALARRNAGRADDEARLLERHGVRVLVSDIPAFPLTVARRLGVPSVVITNFTWAEIYAEIVRHRRRAGDFSLADRGERLVEALSAEYAQADLLLAPGLALEMPAFARRRDVPIVARRGRPRRAEICRLLSLDPERPLVLLYLGREGLTDLDWSALDRLREVQFVGFGAVEGPATGIIHALPDERIPHADVTASVDFVIGKLGYSLCAECLALGKPLIFPPRPDFVEHEALGAGMMTHGLGVPLSAASFRRGDWAEPLAKARALAAHAIPPPCDGAQVCASILAVAWASGRLNGV